MEPNNEREVDSLEKMKKRLLYSSQSISKHARKSLTSVSKKAENVWGNAAPYVNKTKRMIDHPSAFKRFFIGALVFAVLAFIVAGIMLWKGGNTVSTKNVDIAVLGNSFTQGGEALPLQIQVVNNNSVDLLLADLIMEYPKNTVGGESGEVTRLRTALNTVPARSSVTELFSPVLYGEQGSIKPLKIILEYRLEGSSAVFVVEQNFPVTINEAPVALTVEGPVQTVSNQEMQFIVRVKQVSAVSSSNMIVRVEYPNGFRLAGSDPAPVIDTNVWKLGDMTQGSEKTITIRGAILGQDAEEKTFRVYVGEEDSRDPSKVGTVYNSLLHTVVISRPFIEARLLINGEEGESVAIKDGSQVQGTIEWVNNLPSRITDAEIKLKLTGSYLNRESINAGSGFYDSSQNSIIWNRDTYSEFASIEPGDNGSFRFSFRTTSFGSELPVNPTLSAELTIQASQNNGAGFESVLSGDKMTLKFNSSVELVSEASYSTGPFKNTGPLPPKVENRTTYTVTWNVRNSINPLSGAEVRAVLPFYITWLGAVDPKNETVTYDPATREVVWKVGSVARGLGVINDGRETSFQVGLTPSLSQASSIPQLIGESTLTATDSFTGAALSTTRGSLSTRLLNDPAFRDGYERVVK